MALTSVIRYVKALDSTATDGSGKTGIAFGDITAAYLVDGGTQTALTTATITTLGTWAAPSDAAHINIKKLSDSDPYKGVLEVHFHNTQLATGNKLWLFLSSSGAAYQPLEVQIGAVVANATQVNGTNIDPTASDNYLARIEFDRDTTNATDEYTVLWFKNGANVTTSLSGATPTIQVIKRSDGTDLIAAATAMTQVTSNNGKLKYSATATSGSGSTNERITLGETYFVTVTCSIDSSTRTFTDMVRRDA